MSDEQKPLGNPGAADPDEVVRGQTEGLRRAVRMGSTALLVLALVSAAAWWTLDDLPGLWGALIGAAIGGMFVLFTAIVVIATARTSPQVTGAVLLGTWLLKLIIAIGIVAAIEPLDFYSDRAFLVTLVVAMVVVLGSETVAILRTRTPYVDPA